MPTPTSKRQFPRTREEAGTSPKHIPTPSRPLSAVWVVGVRAQKYLPDIAAVVLFLFAVWAWLGLAGLSSGVFIEALADVLWQAFGWGAIGLPFIVGLVSWLIIARRLKFAQPMQWGRVLALEAATFALLGLLNVFIQGDVIKATHGEGGGMIGWGLGFVVNRLIPSPYDALALGALLVGGLFLGVPSTANRLARLGQWLRDYGFPKDAHSGGDTSATDQATEAERPPQPRVLGRPIPLRLPGLDNPKPVLPVAKSKSKLTASERVHVPVETAANEIKAKPKKRDKQLPSLDLLDNKELRPPVQRDIDSVASIIVKTLKEFGVPVDVVGARVGPSVTQYQVEPGFVEKPGALTGSAAKLLEALHALGAHCAKHSDLSERDLADYALNKTALVAALGYEPDKDDAIEQSRATVILRAAKGRAPVVIEFRRPNKALAVSDKAFDLAPAPEVGAVCNGHALWLFRFNGPRMMDEPLAQIDLAQASEANVRATQTWLGKRQQWKVRVAQIATLKDDLALALSANTLRIEAPVPGQSYVGIEVPHRRNSTVSLRPVMESEAFQKVNAPLAIALGRDVSGASIAADLGSMPHLLIAGTTGSGKSVCITSLVTCLAVNNTPDDLRLVLIDPKMVELVRFNGLPHLMGKVETDLDRITGVLRWVVREMERRYKLFEELSVRNLANYISKTGKQKDAERLPRVVLVIDELADLMMRAPDETERTVVRLAQMARATGIHLVVATQRPSVDVVTGLIKANFPARISFAVASSIDSRVILDTPGAESLLGKGDMLFLAPEVGAPQRLQGCFVSDKEVEKIVDYWREQMADDEPEPAPDFGAIAAETTATPPTAPGAALAPWDGMLAREAAVEDKDAQIAQAIQIVKKYGNASASLLQRKMRLGYPRAARLMDELKQMGVIGREQAGGKTREVFVRGDDDPIGDRAAKILGGEDDDEE